MTTHPNPQTLPVDNNDQARQLIDAVNAALAEQQPISYRDDTPLPTVGTAPPVPQPGRPPMSQAATDASALMLCGGAATVLAGGGVSLVMLASGAADPVVCAVVLGAPAVLVLALSRLLARAKTIVEAAPPTHHHHYAGLVDQRSITNDTRGVIARSTTRSR